MKRASITETKANLSALIDGLGGDSPVLIVDRGAPSRDWSRSTSARKMNRMDGCFSSSETGCFARAGATRGPLSSALLRRAPKRQPSNR